MKPYDHKPVRTARSHYEYGHTKLHRDPEFTWRNLILGALTIPAGLALVAFAVAILSTPRP